MGLINLHTAQTTKQMSFNFNRTLFRLSETEDNTQHCLILACKKKKKLNKNKVQKGSLFKKPESKSVQGMSSN